MKQTAVTFFLRPSLNKAIKERWLEVFRDRPTYQIAPTLLIGQKVKHPKLGAGIVTKVHPSSLVTAAFGSKVRIVTSNIVRVA